MNTITTRILLAPNLTNDEAHKLAVDNDCSAYYLVIPPSMEDNIKDGDTFPLIIEEEWPQYEGTP